MCVDALPTGSGSYQNTYFSALLFVICIEANNQVVINSIFSCYMINHAHARNVFMMDFAVKTNNLELFHYCNGIMAELFFAYDGHNNSRLTIRMEHFSLIKISYNCRNTS